MLNLSVWIFPFKSVQSKKKTKKIEWLSYRNKKTEDYKETKN